MWTADLTDGWDGPQGELIIDVPEDVEFDVDATDEEIVIQWWRDDEEGR